MPKLLASATSHRLILVQASDLEELMKMSFCTAAVGLSLVTVVALVKLEGYAQTGGAPEPATDVVPPAALLTDRGTELVYRLRQLRQTEQRLGAKHPTLPVIREQISQIKEQLEAWSPARDRIANNAAASASGDNKPVPMMNERDLRQLVLVLVQEIEELRDRVSQLEQTVGAPQDAPQPGAIPGSRP